MLNAIVITKRFVPTLIYASAAVLAMLALFSDFVFDDMM